MADRPSPASLPASAAPSMALFRTPHALGGTDDLHELRVRISLDLHRQLLSLKVLRGKSLGETVAEALDAYFARKADAERAAREEPAES